MTKTSNGNKLGVALLGLGEYAEGQLAPALKKTEHCYLAGIITGSPGKVSSWQSKYDIPDSNVYNYENFENIKDNPEIDIIYIVTPNSLHADFVVRAAGAGKHIITEKPMATSIEDCDRMIKACKDAGVTLSVGYRLRFEPYNLEMTALAKAQSYGTLQKVIAHNGMDGTHGWRMDKDLAGGGPLMDLGIYCVQAARYVTGLEPIAVTAKEGVKKRPQDFKDVEESISWIMEFGGGTIAECSTSYSEEMNLLRAETSNGWFELSPAFPYSGIKGKTSHGEMKFEQVEQQALQMDHIAVCVKSGTQSKVPGEMGRQDVKIILAIYEAMHSGQRVLIDQ